MSTVMENPTIDMNTGNIIPQFDKVVVLVWHGESLDHNEKENNS